LTRAVLLLEAALLGVVQGLTEFLPVSSSAHLILARVFFGWDAEQFGRPFDVACHLGTLGAILIYFRQDLAYLLRALPDVFRRTTADTRLLVLIVIGTVPLVPIGAFLADRADAIRTPAVIVVTLTVVGIAMLIAERRGRQIREAEELTWLEALLLGVAQALALIPGVSRSGATITTGLFLGLERQSAARFSFLLGVPAMLAAALHEGKRLIGQPMDALSIQVFVIGILVSGLVGYATVKYFLRYVASRGLDVFAWYRIALAVATVAWLLMRTPH
jgi:undecaprenyl-diphosphatase